MLRRPLTGEPLALDLVNTWWIDRGTNYDLLDAPGGAQSWLREHDLLSTGIEADMELVLPALRQARSAVRACLERPGKAAERDLNAVLAHGIVHRQLQDASPTDQIEAPTYWLPAWAAATSYLNLLNDRPERIRRCDHAACVLYFYDTSRNGTRRWCSMQGCGNRAKASRHYARTRATANGTAAGSVDTG